MNFYFDRIPVPRLPPRSLLAFPPPFPSAPNLSRITGSAGHPPSESGEVSEWLKEHAWKVCKRLNRASGVRIPLSPPDQCKPLFTQGFLLFWKIIRRDKNRDTTRCEFPTISSAPPLAAGPSGSESRPTCKLGLAGRSSSEVCEPRICVKPSCKPSSWRRAMLRSSTQFGGCQ